MAATFKTEYILTTAENEADLNEKYEKIYLNDLLDFGRGGYTGSFAEKPAVELITGKWKLDAARDDADNNPKWGPTWAYNIDDGGTYFAGWCSS